ncbi:MAG: hypothetical protein GY906_23410 [bacterium]|nr:hypothetical protein [bacterium]
MRFLLLLVSLLAFLPASDPPKALGAKLAVAVVNDGVIAMHEHGFAHHFTDGSMLTSVIGDNPSYSVTWEWSSPSGPIPITVTYPWPVPNPTEAQRRLYRRRFKEEVKEMLLLFPRT